MSTCQCFGCVPTRVETSTEEEGPHCSVCLLSMGDGFPSIPCVGNMEDYSICIDCAYKYHLAHRSPDKRDPATRKWMVTCTRCGEVVHRFNICLHFHTHDTPPGQVTVIRDMEHFRAFAERTKAIRSKNAREAPIVID
jgi:hypothetical protein